MLSPSLKKEFYKALISKDQNYDGIFYIGVKTTGIFCRSICPARKPKFENCQFFKKAKDALLAGFRPCMRCRPLSHPNEMPEVVQKLLKAVDKHPEKRWKEQDFRELSTNAVQALRLFKKRFKMTFTSYVRERRMGTALKQIKENKLVIDAQIDLGYESGSGFRDAFSKIMGVPPIKSESINLFKADWIDTPLGTMIAIGDDKDLYMLEFVNRPNLEKRIEKLLKMTKSSIIPGKSPPIDSIKKELSQYFKGTLDHFSTPIKMIGSPFQKSVWLELNKIQFGETLSYLDIANALKNKGAVRAVGSANGANHISIVIPCHRVINKGGKLGGYAGGLARKRWLLEHESKYEK